jgi:hypothetical protein
MAEGRMLRKKISRDGRVAQLSAHAALLYVMAIPHLDVDGRMDGSPVAVRGTVVPALASAHINDDEWSDTSVAGYIVEWTGTHDEDDPALPRALVAHYCIGGTWVCHFAGFAENQQLRRDRERPSSFPPPPSHLLKRLGIDPDADSGQPPEQPRTQAEAEVQDQQPPDQRGPSRARYESVAALPDHGFSETPLEELAAQVTEGVARRQAALATHGPLARLLEILPDADENTPAVLHAAFDPLGPAAIEHARREIVDLAGDVRRPSAYAVGIAKRLQREQAAT